MSDPAGDVAHLITSARRARDPLVVAIDGLGGAGKSTLADALRAGLENVSIVRGDDFYRPMDADARAALGPREGYERSTGSGSPRRCSTRSLAGEPPSIGATTGRATASGTTRSRCSRAA